MGYPGKMTDEVMDLIRDLRELAIEIGTYESHPNSGGPGSSPGRQRLQELEDEIYSAVSSLDSSVENYARDMNRGRY